MDGIAQVATSASRGIEGLFGLVGGIIATIAIIVAAIILVKLCYKKVPPDQAFIISGLHKKPRLVSGRATFTVPIVQRIDRLSLGLIQSNIETSAPVPTADFIEVSVSAVVNFQISSDPEQIEKAQRNFLNFGKDEISKLASEVLEGSMREIIGQMFIKDMVTDRETFNGRVIQTAKPDLNNMGLDLISFNVQNFKDERGVIDKLGMDQTAQITRDAAIAKIAADREVELKNAEARDVTNQRNTQTDRAIAEREQELAVMRAQLQIEQDTKKAEADLAYQIQTETKTRELEIAKQEAAIAKQEKEIELKEREVQITERQLEAEVNKRADADLYAKQQAAEGALFEVKKNAEAEKAQADADRYRLEAEAAAQAEVGRAQASVIEAKGQAEAKANELKGLAIANALKEQAEAYNEMQNPYALLEKYIEALPLIARAVADPLSRVGNITMYGDGNVATLVEETTRTTSQLNAAISESLGFDIQGLLNGAVTGRAIGNGMAQGTRANGQGDGHGGGQAADGAGSAAPPAAAAEAPAGQPAQTPPPSGPQGGQTPRGDSKDTGGEGASRAAEEDADPRPSGTPGKSLAGGSKEHQTKALERAVGEELVNSLGGNEERARLSDLITQAYTGIAALKGDKATAKKVRTLALECLEGVDLASLNTPKAAAAFIRETLVPALAEGLAKTAP